MASGGDGGSRWPELIWGRSRFDLDQIGYVLVPGYGRVDGSALTEAGRQRAQTAAAVLDVLPDGTTIVCTGYKSPADRNPRPDTHVPDRVGIAEADLMVAELERIGVSPARLRTEVRSVDTVSNLLCAEADGCFHDGRAVAIVAQRAHLERIVHVIAPATLRRPFVGVVAPGEHTSAEGAAQRLASRVLLARLPEDRASAADIAIRRAERAWRWIERVRGHREYHG